MMSGARSDISLTLETGINKKRILWLETYYYTIPYNIVESTPVTDFTYKCGGLKPTYIDTFFEFEIWRLTELHFRIVFIRISGDHPLPDGSYMFQFLCDANVFNEDQKIILMQSNEFKVFEDFWLNASYCTDLSSNEFKKQFEFKISVQIIEFDYVFPFDIVDQLEELRQTFEIFKNTFAFMEMLYILNIRKLEDVFAGRLNGNSTNLKLYYIKRTAKYSTRIVHYLKLKNSSNTAPAADVEIILNGILNEKEGRLHDSDLIEAYFDAHYLGLNFLIVLCRDCLLHRLSEHETSSQADYEYLFFDLLNAAVRVNDDYLFEKCAQKFLNTDNEHFVLGSFMKKLEMTIHSRFVLCCLERRVRKIELHRRIGIGAAETSKFLELL